MPLRIIWSRISIDSTTDVPVTRQRPPSSASNVEVSRLTPSGSPSNAQVCTIRSAGRTSWNEPQKTAVKSSPARLAV